MGLAFRNFLLLPNLPRVLRHMVPNLAPFSRMNKWSHSDEKLFFLFPLHRAPAQTAVSILFFFCAFRYKEMMNTQRSPWMVCRKCVHREERNSILENLLPIRKYSWEECQTGKRTRFHLDFSLVAAGSLNRAFKKCKWLVLLHCFASIKTKSNAQTAKIQSKWMDKLPKRQLQIEHNKWKYD